MLGGPGEDLLQQVPAYWEPLGWQGSLDLDPFTSGSRFLPKAHLKGFGREIYSFSLVLLHSLFLILPNKANSILHFSAAWHFHIPLPSLHPNDAASAGY